MDRTVHPRTVLTNRCVSCEIRISCIPAPRVRLEDGCTRCEMKESKGKDDMEWTFMQD